MKKAYFLLIAALTCLVAQAANALNVHSLNSKLYVASISDAAEYSVIDRVGSWHIVQFSKPSVPVWVSEDYLQISGASASVTANKLNMRFGANRNSKVLGAVSRGYRSPVLETKNGFARILAPVSLRFSLRNERGGTATAANNEVRPEREERGESKWSMPRNSLESQEAPVLAEPTSSVVTKASKVIVPDRTQASVLPNLSEGSSGSVEAEQHRLSPGDTISLQVFGEDDMSLSHVRIPQSGAVSFPLIGSVDVATKTTKQVEAVIKQKLSQGYIRDPRLSITIDSYRPIFIKGAVQNIGAFPYTEGLTIAKALALAGGAKLSAMKDGVSISRDGAVIKELLSINSQDRVSSGDIITVTEELGGDEGSAFYVYLHGEVNRPGEYLFRRGLTVEKAVVLAGGFTLRASRKKISVSRATEEEPEPVKLKKVPLHLPIEPGDIIDVGASWF